MRLVMTARARDRLLKLADLLVQLVQHRLRPGQSNPTRPARLVSFSARIKAGSPSATPSSALTGPPLAFFARSAAFMTSQAPV